MDAAAIGIIVLRLTVPLLIVRFPMVGLLLSAAFDVIDYSILGVHDWYQPVDKLLDIYYLTFCLRVALHLWHDPRARTIAAALYVVRLIGVVALSFGAPGWVLLLTPNIFEMLFVFYTLHWRITRRNRLFHSYGEAPLLFAALLLPKLLQEYSLHVSSSLPTDHPAHFLSLPMGITGVAIWMAAPLAALVWYSKRTVYSYKPGKLFSLPHTKEAQAPLVANNYLTGSSDRTAGRKG